MAACQELRQQKEFLEADRSKLWTVAGKGQRREALGFIGGLLDRDGKPQAPKPYTQGQGLSVLCRRDPRVEIADLKSRGSW